MREGSLPVGVNGVHGGAAALVVVVVVGGLLLARPTLKAVAIQSNEDQALSDLVEFAAAEVTFRAAFGGFGGPAVLSDPQWPPAGGAAIGHRRFLWPVRNGYRFVFRSGRPDGPFAPMPQASELPSFTYIAFPLVPDETGRRSFMFDSVDGAVHARADGGEPRRLDPVLARP